MATWRAALGPYAGLEARRNRLLYAGWPVVILGSLPLAAAIAMASDYPASQGVAAALLGWVVGGLPLTAILFGAVAGAGLRGAAEDAEAALPVSPRAKILKALASAAAALAFSAVLLAGLTMIVAPDASAFLRLIFRLGYNWNTSHSTVALLISSTLVSALLGLFWLQTVSFGVSFVFARSVLGGVAALFVGVTGLLPHLAGLMLPMNAEARAGFLTATVACSAALAAGALGALERSASPALRGARWNLRHILMLALLPVAGSVAAWSAMYWAQDGVLAVTGGVWASDGRNTGRLTPGLAGVLVIEGPEGTVELLPGWAPTLADLVRGQRPSELKKSFWDSEGTFWAEVHHPGTQRNLPYDQIWVGRGDGPLHLYLSMYDGVLWPIDDQAFLVFAGSRASILLDPARPPLLKSQR